MNLEQVVKYQERDKFMQHEDCGGELERNQGLELPTLGKEGYQCKAILADGSKIAGHFGKEAKRKPRR